MTQSICKYCGKISNNYGIKGHVWRVHTIAGQIFGSNGSGMKGKVSWNHGLKKETDIRVAKACTKISNALKGLSHGPLTEIQKQKVSDGMKLAHSEGRAWNIGKSRWNNKQSYPEQFFSTVIANEFVDKQYITEYPLRIYSLDFAWPQKKKCIEIDGAQHFRFQEYIDRDKRKNIAIAEEGWKCLRIKWSEMYANPQKCIAQAKEFIGR